MPVSERDHESFAEVCGGLDYGGAPSSFVPLQESLLSLRPEGSHPRCLRDIVSGGVVLTCDDVNSCVLPQEQAAHNLQEAGLVSAFMDPGVRRSKKKYHRVLRRLWASGMLDYVDGSDREAAREYVGFYAPPKKTTSRG